MSSELTTTSNKVRELKTFLEKHRDTITKAAIKGVSADRLIKTATMLLLKKDFEGRDSSLLQCTNESILLAITECARIGLDPSFGRAYMIPYGNKANLQLGYMGLIELAKRSGKVESIVADIVREGDDFYVEQGTNPIFRHIPKFMNDGSDFKMVYAIAKFGDGHFEYTVLSKAEVEAIKSNKRKKKDGTEQRNPAWDNFYTEMAKKVAIRRLCKTLPLTFEAADAIEEDDNRNIVIDIDNPKIAVGKSTIESIKSDLNIAQQPMEPPIEVDADEPENEDDGDWFEKESAKMKGEK